MAVNGEEARVVATGLNKAWGIYGLKMRDWRKEWRRGMGYLWEALGNKGHAKGRAMHCLPFGRKATDR